MEQNFPNTLLELEDRFGTDDACREYLLQLRWPDGFCCPRCNHDEYWTRSNGLLECKQCSFQSSVTAGTIFQDTKKPLRLLFRAMWHITSQKYGANALGLQRVLGLGSYRTAWSWMHKMRRAMIRPGRERISGIIQVDETLVGGQKTGKRGRGAFGKTLVLVMAQVDGKWIGRIRLCIIPDASGKSLRSAILQFIEPGSIVRTDGWKGYNIIEKDGYTHQIVRGDAQVGDDLLPYCHRVASLLKRWLMGTLQGAVSSEHLAYYLDEFTFRFNRRRSKSRGKLFYRLVQQAVMVEPAPLKTLVKQARGKRPGLKT